MGEGADRSASRPSAHPRRSQAELALPSLLPDLLLLILPALALVFPTLSGRVVDEANILDQAARAALTQKLADLEAKTTDQLVVVTLKSLQGTSIEDFGYQLGRHWRIGQKDKNNGVLLIVVPSERKVRIDVGYGLEGTLTDAVSRLIIENAIVPRFRANDYPGGIARGVDDIISVLTGDAAEWKARAAKRPDRMPGGGSIFIIALIAVIFMMVYVDRRRHPRPPAERPPPRQLGQRLDQAVVVGLILVVGLLRRLLRRWLFGRRFFGRWWLVRRRRVVG